MEKKDTVKPLNSNKMTTGYDLVHMVTNNPTKFEQNLYSSIRAVCPQSVPIVKHEQLFHNSC